MRYVVRRADAEIDEVLNQCVEQGARGSSRWPGMTYEEGVAAGIRWVTDETETNPMEDD